MFARTAGTAGTAGRNDLSKSWKGELEARCADGRAGRPRVGGQGGGGAADGVRTVLPVMEGPHEALVFREWRPGDVLVPGMFGVEEPAADAPALTPDIVVTPLLAFDAAGNRLGYGGGFYDRTLRGLRARYNTLAIGGAYDEQEFPTLPVHTGDAVLDMIITDRRILSVGM